MWGRSQNSMKPRDFSAVNRPQRLRLPSRGLPVRPVAERVGDFDEAILLMDANQARYEARRCIHCADIAPCQQACPARNDISYALWLIEHGEFLEAASIYRKTSNFPEICGRVCPQEKLCEGACVLCRRGEPVLTGALEAFVCEYERRVKGVEILPPPPTGRKVAVVGAGPSGLACAEQLVRCGHWVTVYDAHATAGGALSYGFPNFKLPHALVMDIWKDLQRAGVGFVGNTYIGRKKTVNDLFKEGYDALFLGVGSGIDAPLDLKGENLPGVYKATDFLVRANAIPRSLPARQRHLPEVGRRVVVIGGGDPATDCARTARRLGAEEITCLYRYTEQEIPGRKRDRLLAEEEGVRFMYLTQPLSLVAGEDGRLSGLECQHVELGVPDEAGHRTPELAGDSFFIPAENVVVAQGYYPDPIITATTPGLKTQKWGLLIADHDTGSTTRFGVFTGGDVVTGPDMVVNAMMAGRKAAFTIDAYLS